jgi:anti-anti-sigma regulatory factor
MEIRTTQSTGTDPVTIFEISGDIDASNYQKLQEEAGAAYEHGTRRLILDLSGVNYISSAGVRAISSIFKMLWSTMPRSEDAAMNAGMRAGTFKSPHLKLASPSPSVRQLLATAGVDMFLEIHSDVEQAVESYT